MSTLIQVSELSLFTEDKEPIFQEISFHVADGEVAVLTGLDSTRHSALLNTLIGELKPDSGQILMAGRNVVRISKKKLLSMRKKELGFLPRDFILPQRRVGDGLRFKMKSLGSPYEMESKIEDTLSDLGLSGEGGSFPSELSALQRFKYALALSVVHRPQLLLCEAPDAAVSLDDGKAAFDLLKQVQKNCNLTILSTSDSISDEDSELKVIPLDGGGGWSQTQ